MSDLDSDKKIIPLWLTDIEQSPVFSYVKKDCTGNVYKNMPSKKPPLSIQRRTEIKCNGPVFSSMEKAQDYLDRSSSL